MAGFENRTLDWLDLKMLGSIVLVRSSDWFSLFEWPKPLPGVQLVEAEREKQKIQRVKK